jgi:hypothetical protein
MMTVVVMITVMVLRVPVMVVGMKHKIMAAAHCEQQHQAANAQ